MVGVVFDVDVGVLVEVEVSRKVVVALQVNSVGNVMSTVAFAK